jgi:hypothetical protein
MRTMLQGTFFLVLITGLVAYARAADAADKGFSFQDTPGQHLDILLDGRLAARYMYAHDNSTPMLHEATYKPYLHVFDAEGKEPITKGPGGLYTHHRGIFVGWNQIKFDKKSIDRWHMKGGEIVHQKFLDKKANADEATFTSLADWNDSEGRPFLVEERTMTIRRGPDAGRLAIDFHSKFSAPRGDVTLGGDPEHAGVQYRPANEVDLKQTVYYLPKENANAHKDLDYPWLGETYVLNDKKYSVVELNHPGNPTKTRISAYRNYGRFGFFPKATVKKDEPLELNYRFLVFDGEMPSAAAIQKWWDEYAHVTAASPVPAVSVVPAEQGGPASAPPVKKPVKKAATKPAKKKS